MADSLKSCQELCTSLKCLLLEELSTDKETFLKNAVLLITALKRCNRDVRVYSEQRKQMFRAKGEQLDKLTLDLQSAYEEIQVLLDETKKNDVHEFNFGKLSLSEEVSADIEKVTEISKNSANVIKLLQKEVEVRKRAIKEKESAASLNLKLLKQQESLKSQLAEVEPCIQRILVAAQPLVSLLGYDSEYLLSLDMDKYKNLPRGLFPIFSKVKLFTDSADKLDNGWDVSVDVSGLNEDDSSMNSVTIKFELSLDIVAVSMMVCFIYSSKEKSIVIRPTIVFPEGLDMVQDYFAEDGLLESLFFLDGGKNVKIQENNFYLYKWVQFMSGTPSLNEGIDQEILLFFSNRPIEFFLNKIVRRTVARWSLYMQYLSLRSLSLPEEVCHFYRKKYVCNSRITDFTINEPGTSYSGNVDDYVRDDTFLCFTLRVVSATGAVSSKVKIQIRTTYPDYFDVRSMSSPEETNKNLNNYDTMPSSIFEIVEFTVKDFSESDIQSYVKVISMLVNQGICDKIVSIKQLKSKRLTLEKFQNYLLCHQIYHLMYICDVFEKFCTLNRVNGDAGRACVPNSFKSSTGDIRLQMLI